MGRIVRRWLSNQLYNGSENFVSFSDSNLENLVILQYLNFNLNVNNLFASILWLKAFLKLNY